MNYTELFERIDSLYSRYVDVWEDVCNIESPTNFKAGVDAVGNYFVDMAKARGWRVERFAQSVSGDIITITMNPEANDAPITLSAHIDTVHPLGLFGTPAVHRDNENIYGPGVTDCKGGAVAAFLAMEALEECGYKARPIRLVLQSDEEVGSRLSGRATIDYICESSKGSVAFLNLEPHGSNNKVTVARKGISSLIFKVTGAAGHSSLCATQGANAIVEASHKAIEMDKFKDHKGVTCNVGIITGGTVVNAIPAYCEFNVNVRYVDEAQLEWIVARAQEIADKVYVPGCKTELVHVRGRMPMLLEERNIELLNKLNAIYSECGLPELVPTHSAGGSDAAEVTAAGIPCLDSLGVVGGYIHSKNEYGVLDSLRTCAFRVGAAVMGL